MYELSYRAKKKMISSMKITSIIIFKKLLKITHEENIAKDSSNYRFLHVAIQDGS